MMITAQNISKVYVQGDTSVRAVNQVSLGIQPGEFVVIMGKSGSGKSTLLHILGGLDRPSEGSVFFDNNNLYEMKDRQLTILRRQRMGFIFQSYNLVSELNAIDNIRLPMFLDKRKADADFEKYVIDSLELGDRLRFYPKQLSGGQQQRVAVARAILSRPDVLFADEPTGNLDSVTGEKLLAILKKSNIENGQTIVMVTHDRDIGAQGNRLIYLEDGLINTKKSILG